MAGSFATTAIITKGLHGGPACSGIITSHFSLFLETAPPPPVIIKSGGGPYPGAAWNKIGNIRDFYKPVQSEQPYLTLRDKEPFANKNLIVTLRVKIGDINVEKIYAVPEHRRKMAIYIFNIIDASKKKIRIFADKIKKIGFKGKVLIDKLRIKKSNDK